MKILLFIFLNLILFNNLYAVYDPFSFNQFYTKDEKKVVNKKDEGKMLNIINKGVKKVERTNNYNKMKNKNIETNKKIVKKTTNRKIWDCSDPNLPPYQRCTIKIKKGYKKQPSKYGTKIKIEPSENYKKMMREWEKNKYNYFRK
jgi:hypothetical protein